MHGAVLEADSLSAPSNTSSVPFSLEQAPISRTRIVFLILSAIALPAVLAPALLMAAHLAGEPAARDIIAQRPHVALLPLLGLTVVLAMLAWPLVRLAQAPTGISIGDGRVTARASGPMDKGWNEPLADYMGLTHRVRSSLSGVRHELILVHRDPARCVLLHTAPRISEETMSRATEHFALAEIPSREAASFVPMYGLCQLQDPQPTRI